METFKPKETLEVPPYKLGVSEGLTYDDFFRYLDNHGKIGLDKENIVIKEFFDEVKEKAIGGFIKIKEVSVSRGRDNNEYVMILLDVSPKEGKPWSCAKISPRKKDR